MAPGERPNQVIRDSYRFPEAFILWREGNPKNEYFLLENRQALGFDANIRQAGLLIWHIDNDKFDFGTGGYGWNNNGNADETHRGVDLLEADGKETEGAGDPFPGTSQNRLFDRNSTPNSRDYNGYDTGVSVANINVFNLTVTAALRVSANLLSSVLIAPREEAFYRAGEQILVHGSADATRFQGYALDFGQGLQPTQWTPILSSLPDTSFANIASLMLTLDQYVYDRNDPDSTLKWSASGNSSIRIAIDQSTSRAYLYAPGFVGSETIIFVVTDPQGASARDTMRVTVGTKTTLVSHTSGEVPLSFKLSQNAPNPFNPSTTIAYDLPRDLEVNLVIYEIGGRRVRTLVNRKQPAGYYAIAWDGRNERGERVPSGVYLYAMTAGEFNATRKMIVLK